MITREEFLNKIQQFTEEEQQKCLKYYDESTSKSKEEIIDGDDSKKLLSTVCRWYGIVTSTKERKPRTTKQQQQAAAELELTNIGEKYHKAINKVAALITNEKEEAELNNIKEVLSSLISLANTRIYELQNPTRKEEEELKEMIIKLNNKIKRQGREFKLEIVKID